MFDLKVDGVGYATSGGKVDDISAAPRRLQGRDHRRPDHGRDDAVVLTPGRRGPGPDGSAPGPASDAEKAVEAWPGSRAEADAEYAVELAGITKRFPGVVANSDIHLRGAPR